MGFCAVQSGLVCSQAGAIRSSGENEQRAENPFSEDLEQLFFVCEQNLRLLGEDLQDQGANSRVIKEGKGGKVKMEEGEKKDG